MTANPTSADLPPALAAPVLTTKTPSATPCCRACKGEYEMTVSSCPVWIEEKQAAVRNFQVESEDEADMNVLRPQPADTLANFHASPRQDSPQDPSSTQEIPQDSPQNSSSTTPPDTPPLKHEAFSVTSQDFPPTQAPPPTKPSTRANHSTVDTLTRPTSVDAARKSNTRQNYHNQRVTQTAYLTWEVFKNLSSRISICKIVF